MNYTFFTNLGYKVDLTWKLWHQKNNDVTYFYSPLLKAKILSTFITLITLGSLNVMGDFKGFGHVVSTTIIVQLEAQYQ